MDLNTKRYINKDNRTTNNYTLLLLDLYLKTEQYEKIESLVNFDVDFLCYFFDVPKAIGMLLQGKQIDLALLLA